MVTITGMDELKASVGRDLGTSRWRPVDQEAVTAFAELTGDRYWIHTDVPQARASPFGGTIAHGYFTLTLGPALLNELVSFDGFRLGLNYGVNRIRFPAPMPVGHRVRMHATLVEVADIDDGAQVTLNQLFEREGGSKPVCVADLLLRFYPA